MIMIEMLSIMIFMVMMIMAMMRMTMINIIIHHEKKHYFELTETSHYPILFCTIPFIFIYVYVHI